MGAYEYDSIPTGDDDDDNGGGGCNTDSFLPSMLLLIAPLLFLARKK